MTSWNFFGTQFITVNYSFQFIKMYYDNIESVNTCVTIQITHSVNMTRNSVVFIQESCSPIENP